LSEFFTMRDLKLHYKEEEQTKEERQRDGDRRYIIKYIEFGLKNELFDNVLGKNDDINLYSCLTLEFANTSVLDYLNEA